MVHNNGRAYQPHKNTTGARGQGEFEIGTRSVGFHPLSPEMIRERPDPKPLHNFALPLLGWGCQRVMRFVKEFDCPTSPLSSSMISERGHRSLVPLPCHRARFSEEDGEGIGAVRVKSMSDMRTETDQFQKELLKCDDDVTEAEEEPVGKLSQSVATAGRQEEEEAVETSPWNLRTRRAACKAQAASNGYPEKEKKREKFSVSLKRKEVEDDLMRLMGRRPPQRQKKRRNNAVQKQLDLLFPGLWLTEVTADTYKVVEVLDKVNVTNGIP